MRAVVLSAVVAGAACFQTGSAAFAPASARNAFSSPVIDRTLRTVSMMETGKRAAEIKAVATAAMKDTDKELEDKMWEYVKARGGRKLIRKILIANNGMASTKTIMSIRNWAYNTFGDERAIKFVVMATPEDLAANAEFIRRADEFVQVPGGSNANNYANVQLIVDLCISQGVDALMVGWGHASENPKLGDLLSAKNAELGLDITFVGPQSPVMRILGDKIGANLVAQSAGVSVPPWNGDGLPANLDANKRIPQEAFDAACITSLEQAVKEAERVGYPVMLKASEGGGGKGIRKALTEAELRTAWPQVVNEVPGSPIFLVTLCTGARHLEVQVIADGETAIALGGRDCSTQRRYQKIFEEGPPIIADEDIFVEMQRAACNLCNSLDYVSAGTVEYLYLPKEKKYYFLELNPRLQVEHPVTEGITGVSLPATQIHIAMGIKLYNIPEIRRFYGQDYDAIGKFDLSSFKRHSQYDKHVIAARITAENPDEGFKPTSGKIDRITFQSNTNVWGYFSVTADGGVHEYADSQFGHLFATGPTREVARKNLVMALKELFIMGDIRTTIEYLGELLETDAFKENTIDTAWLDGIIAQKSVTIDIDPTAAVINAAVFRAYKQIQGGIANFKDNLGKGQLSTLPLKELQSIPVDITYADVKYSFRVTPKAPDTMVLKIGAQSIEVRYREQADGSIYVAYGVESHQVFAKEEALGLRMVLDGVTVLLPTLYDPSELRSDITGKLVRYTIEDGATVKKGETYAEAEAMKMIITLKATESGVIKHEKPAGSIINQGDLLASLTLADPSRVKKIGAFSGTLEYATGEEMVTGSATLKRFRKAQKTLELVMDGYVLDAEPAVQAMLSALASVNLPIEEIKDAASALGQKMPVELDAMMQQVYATTLAEHVNGMDSTETATLVTKLRAVVEEYVKSLFESKQADMRITIAPVTAQIDKYAKGLRENAVDVTCALLSRYVNVESSFVDMSTDQAVGALVKAYPKDLQKVYAMAFAHEQLKGRNLLVISMLRQLSGFPERFGVEPLRTLPPALNVVVTLSQMPGAEYKEVALNAAKFGLMKAEKPFDEAVRELKAELKSGMEEAAVSRSVVTNALLALFGDAEVGLTAMQVALKRWYRTFNIISMSTGSKAGATTIEFKYKAADKAQGDTPFPERYGMLAYVTDLKMMQSKMGDLIKEYAGKGPEPYNSLHIALAGSIADGANAEEELIATVQATLASHKAALEAKGIRLVSLMVPNPPKWPRQFSFPMANGYTEDKQRRNLFPTQYNLLELKRLDNWSPERLPSISRNTLVLLGSQGDKKKMQQRVFVRGITHGTGLENPAVAEAAVQKALDELQLAMLDPRVASGASSHLMMHILGPFPGASVEDIIGTWKDLMSGLISKYATRLLKLRVDEIEVRAHVGSGASRQAVRLVASSMAGQWLKTDGFVEYLDPITGETQAYCSPGDPETAMCFIEPYPISSSLSTKRMIARGAGSTYAYDFLGMIEKALVSEWSSAVTDGRFTSMPSDIFAVEELLLTNGALAPGQRVVGTNDVGMVGWIATLKTPEYPDGRPLAIVANDCTVQSGSFGIQEDNYFDAFSKYARAGGLPRLHIACNSGARIGLAEELKPFFKVAWVDPRNEAAGFKYLYMTPADAAKMGGNSDTTFHGELVNDDGEERFKLIDIVGKQDGLGVENLRGSGMIAGETSKAYDETFTLSYVTGRSVGIGAYLNRLAQRVIQMQQGPLILTGYSALNKLLGKEVYVSQDQLGGPQIMLPNGIAHQLATDDQDGVEKILRWLSYVPRTAFESQQPAASVDPVDRDIVWTPPNTPYDPRMMLAGAAGPDGTFKPGFFDQGSFTEYLASWGKSVIVGRARLGGIPMGVIAVETRLTETIIPADPANPASRQTNLAQAGQVWFPDSAYKTAQALADFNAAENLPVMLFANWRGFSGGTRDMFGEVLKFGAQIVDNLRVYKHPVFVYIPPNGELRGGAWVVVDPTINSEMMEMYVDENARGGILEPPGICDVKFRKPDLLKTMHRLDSKLIQLDAELAAAESSEALGDTKDIQAAIGAREAQLMPLYVQISHEFADLHDRPGRMLAKGVIRDIVPWKRARQYFFWRVRRRLLQDAIVKQLKVADTTLSHADCLSMLTKWIGEKAAWSDDKAVVAAFESNGPMLDKKLGEVRVEAVQKAVAALLATLPADVRKKVVGSM